MRLALPKSLILHLHQTEKGLVGAGAERRCCLARPRPLPAWRCTAPEIGVEQKIARGNVAVQDAAAVQKLQPPHSINGKPHELRAALFVLARGREQLKT